MGIQDVNLLLSSAQAVTASAVSTNTIDLGVANDIGEGKPLFLEGIVTTAAFTTCTSIEVQAITSAAANLGTPTVIGSSGAIPVASLTLGARFYVALNPRVGSLGQRYLGANYVVVGTNAAAGTMTTSVVTGIMDGAKVYGSGYSVK